MDRSYGSLQGENISRDVMGFISDTTKVVFEEPTDFQARSNVSGNCIFSRIFVIQRNCDL